MNTRKLAIVIGTSVLTTVCFLASANKATAGTFSTSINCPDPNVGIFTDEWMTGFLTGSGGTIELGNDDKFTFDVTCNNPGKVTLSDTGWFESDESYHIKFKGMAGEGAFKLNFLAYLTQDDKEINGTSKSWSSPLIGSIAGGATEQDYPWYGNLVNKGNSLTFNDLHFEVSITSTQPAKFTWSSVSLGVDANKIIPESNSFLSFLAFDVIGMVALLKRHSMA